MGGLFGSAGFSVVPNDVQARSDAIRDWVQPSEVGGIVRAFALRRAGVDLVAQDLKQTFAAGTLRYFADPPFADVWRSPADTLQLGGGDCDDLGIFALSILLGLRINAYAAIGYFVDAFGNRQGHLWIEGQDERGFFLLEATSGDLLRRRPRNYQVVQWAHPNWCEMAVA